MRTQYLLTLVVAAGLGIAATAIHGLHAQSKAPVYAVVDIGEIADPEGYKAISQVANADMPNAGGRYLARTDKIIAVDGTAPKRFSIIAFDSLEKAQAWYNSPEMNKISEIRKKTIKARVFFVEGL